MLQGKTITVETLEDHTYDGIPHATGSRYEAEEGHVDYLELRGYARRVPADEPADAPAPTSPKTKTKPPR